MIISCIGHAEFLLELACGLRIVTDPYDASCGYPVMPVDADVVLVSHGHHDHCAVDSVRGYTQVIDAPGSYTLSPGVTVKAIPSWHDDRQGALRGGNLIFLLEAEGLRVAHLGDLGHLPEKEQTEALLPVDVLMLPVGGHFTIDAQTAVQTARLLRAQVVLPMHYRTSANASWPIAPVEAFEEAFGQPAERISLLRVTQGDLACQPRMAVLRPKSIKD